MRPGKSGPSSPAQNALVTILLKPPFRPDGKWSFSNQLIIDVNRQFSTRPKGIAGNSHPVDAAIQANCPTHFVADLHASSSSPGDNRLPWPNVKESILSAPPRWNRLLCKRLLAEHSG